MRPRRRLLIGLILVIAILDIIIPGQLPRWAIFTSVFIPLFIQGARQSRGERALSCGDTRS